LLVGVCTIYAVEFEADVTSPFIQLQNDEQFLNQYVKVIVLAQEAPKTGKMSGDGTHYVKNYVSVILSQLQA
jgi:hypothetical protein